jgi:hypothetical protein
VCILFWFGGLLACCPFGGSRGVLALFPGLAGCMGTGTAPWPLSAPFAGPVGTPLLPKGGKWPPFAWIWSANGDVLIVVLEASEVRDTKGFDSIRLAGCPPGIDRLCSYQSLKNEHWTTPGRALCKGSMSRSNSRGRNFRRVQGPGRGLRTLGEGTIRGG